MTLERSCSASVMASILHRISPVSQPAMPYLCQSRRRSAGNRWTRSTVIVVNRGSSWPRRLATGKRREAHAAIDREALDQAGPTQR